MPTTYSGKNARVSVSGSFLAANKWTILLRNEESDTSSFEAGRKNTSIPGSEDAEISVEAFWEEGLGGDPPNIQQGQYGRIVLFPDFINRPASAWNFPVVLFTSVEVTVEVRGMVKYVLTAKNVFPFWLPPIR